MHQQIQEELQKEARDILNDQALWQPFYDNGKIHPVGSFALNLLVYGDLDLYYEPTHPDKLVDILASGVKNAVCLNEIKVIRFERELYKREPKAPPGIYLQFKIEVKSGRIWQIDIMSANKEYQDAFLKELEVTKSRLTPQNRALILQIKHDLMKSTEHTPSFSSYYVYKAILEEGLKNPDAIKAYLKDQGIRLF